MQFRRLCCLPDKNFRFFSESFWGSCMTESAQSFRGKISSGSVQDYRNYIHEKTDFESSQYIQKLRLACFCIQWHLFSATSKSKSVWKYYSYNKQTKILCLLKSCNNRHHRHALNSRVAASSDCKNSRRCCFYSRRPHSDSILIRI